MPPWHNGTAPALRMGTSCGFFTTPASQPEVEVNNQESRAFTASRFDSWRGRSHLWNLKKDLINDSKKKVVVAAIILIVLIGTFLVINYVKTGKAVSSNSGNSQGTTSSNSQIKEPKVVPLSQEENEKVVQILITSEFIKDVPEKYPIALSFFSFEGNERILHDSFLIGKNTLLSEGNPTVYLSLPTKYIPEFNGNNLCEVIQLANKNRDLGFYTAESTTSLILKYAGMLKHKECFGF